MALETVVFQQDPFSSSSHPYEEYSYPCEFGTEPDHDMTGIETSGKTDTDAATLDWDPSIPTAEWDVGMNSSSSPENFGGGPGVLPVAAAAAAGTGRRKRQRATVVRNKEEVESQRITHIAVERNRRKQMNEYLSVLRSLMPPSYVQRGDQASIIGGAVNFVKELEQLLQSLMAAQSKEPRIKNTADNLSSSPFADFFTFPQYSTDPTWYAGLTAHPMVGSEIRSMAAIADVEVTMVDAHASVKVLSRKQPKQLLKMVVGLQCLCLSILHINVTAVGAMVLYSFSVKVEDNCQLTSGNEIAAAVHEMVGRIQEEAEFS